MYRILTQPNPNLRLFEIILAIWLITYTILSSNVEITSVLVDERLNGLQTVYVSNLRYVKVFKRYLKYFSIYNIYGKIINKIYKNIIGCSPGGDEQHGVHPLHVRVAGGALGLRGALQRRARAAGPAHRHPPGRVEGARWGGELDNLYLG